MGDELLEEALSGIDGDERARLVTTLDRIRQNLSRRPTETLVSNG